ncbi:oxidoreductase [Colletotrichum musicola]|uniref:Oxidoreductase n=1 Tax=Colletotrichum musicola TaxID=2175873 RepID=A0A8H6K2W6_9PEZI|nr:oxidoreductase [Colletotrichum musicola]
MSTPATTNNNNKRGKMGPTLKSLAQDIRDGITADHDHPMAIFALGGEVHIKQSHSSDSPAARTRRASKKAQDASAQAPEEEDASDPIAIRWDPPNEPTVTLRKIFFPLTSDADKRGFKQLLEDTQLATFGRGGDEVLDETYRKAQKLPETAFSTNLCPYKLGIIDTVRQVLLPSVETAEGSRLIRAELYNVNLSFHISSHTHRKVRVDCEHEVFEVKSGHRVTMTYNLYATPGSSSPASQLSAFSPASVPLYSKIKALVASKRFQRKDRIIGFYSTHAYPHTSGEAHTNLPLCLKGIDMAVYETFMSLGANVHLCSVIESRNSYHQRSASDIRTDGGQFSEGEADSAPSKKAAKAKKTRKRRSKNEPSHSLADDQSGSRNAGADWESEEAESSEVNSDVEVEGICSASGKSNEPSMWTVYSHFAMVVEIPADIAAA